jgi:hypothetical protein
MNVETSADTAVACLNQPLVSGGERREQDTCKQRGSSSRQQDPPFCGGLRAAIELDEQLASDYSRHGCFELRHDLPIEKIEYLTD